MATDCDFAELRRGLLAAKYNQAISPAFLSLAAMPGHQPSPKHILGGPGGGFRFHCRSHETELDSGRNLATRLSVLHVSVHRVDGEDPERDQLLALFGLRGDLESRSRYDSNDTTVAMMIDRRQAAGAVVHRGIATEQAKQGAEMEPIEIQARATIAAALILTRAVEVPTIPTSGDWSRDTAALRLRDLTDYVYQMIQSPQPR